MQNQSIQAILDTVPTVISPPDHSGLADSAGLGRMFSILEKLDNPQTKLPPTVHFAGTNGKGSTIAFTRAILENAGYTVHVFTSPHLVMPNERIVLGGAMISDDDFKSYIDRVHHANNDGDITVFELLMAVAFLAFSEHSADVVLLETGLGGRYDATNVIADPMATVITPISLDHTHILGDTIAQIAREKACIQKEGRPSLIAPQEKSALDVLLQYADNIGAKPFVCGQGWGFEPTDDGGFEFLNLKFAQPSLMGHHQITNAATAVATTMILKGEGLDKITPTAMQAGVISATWQARMQKLQRGDIFDAIGHDADVWLDGGHNPSAGRAMADVLASFDDNRPAIFVMAMVDTKDATGYLSPMAKHIDKIYTVDIPDYPLSSRAEDLSALAQSLGIDATPCNSLQTAYQNLIAHRADNPRIFITGSLYFAGYILRNHSS